MKMTALEFIEKLEVADAAYSAPPSGVGGDYGWGKATYLLVRLLCEERLRRIVDSEAA